MQVVDQNNEKSNIRGIMGARYVFAVPEAGQSWEMAVLKDGHWKSITFDQLKVLYMSPGGFYQNTSIPKVEGSKYYIAVPNMNEQWPAPAAIFKGEKWEPIQESELRDLAGKLEGSSLPANIQRGF